MKIQTREQAFAFSDLSRTKWLMVGHRISGAESWVYWWDRTCTKQWHKAKETGHAIAVQDRAGDCDIVFGKLVQC